MSLRSLVIANTTEPFHSLFEKYPSRDERRRLVLADLQLGDRASLWAGDGKLVVTSFPVAHLDHLRSALGYTEIENFFPPEPSDSLCADILADPRLFTRIVDRLGKVAEIELITYAASDQLYSLISALREAGVTLRLVETPDRPGVYSSRHFGTKSGLRVMCTQWEKECDLIRMPPGTICASPREAAREALKRLSTGVSCVCKADKGTAGLGLLWLDASHRHTASSIETQLHADFAFRDDPLVVEDVIVPPSDSRFDCRSPSIEVYITPPEGTVRTTYACVQLIDFGGYFSGVVIDATRIPSSLSQQMEEIAVFVGERLAATGYVGYFDIDFVIDQNQTLYLVDGNPRRTGGTHAHDAARFLLGPDYQQTHVILARNAVSLSSAPASWEALLSRASQTMLPINGETRGVIPTVTAGLRNGTLGYLIIANSTTDAVSLESAFLRLVQSQTV